MSPEDFTARAQSFRSRLLTTIVVIFIPCLLATMLLPVGLVVIGGLMRKATLLNAAICSSPLVVVAGLLGSTLIIRRRLARLNEECGIGCPHCHRPLVDLTGHTQQTVVATRNCVHCGSKVLQ